MTKNGIKKVSKLLEIPKDLFVRVKAFEIKSVVR